MQKYTKYLKYLISQSKNTFTYVKKIKKINELEQ